MFDPAELEALIDLHQRAYALLRWLNSRAKAGTVPLGSVHGALDAADAALDWVSRNFATLPFDARPPADRLEPFAHLFASYLTTSFLVAAKRKVRSSCGCDLCSYLVAGPNLQVRSPTKLDVQVAEQVKLDCLEALAAEAGVPLLRTELATLLAQSPELKRPLALATYARELDRRSRFTGQGRPVLALWRELAWKHGRPDKKFSLRARDVLDAERLLIERLRRFSLA